jgi:glycine cleavage system H protein
MDIKGYNMPEDLYYHQEDTWVKVEADGTVKIGMDDFYQKQAGDTTYVDLPFEGDTVTQGETCGKIQSSKWVGKFVSPISGEITEVNRELENDCRLINKDPYGNGWIIKVKPSNMDAELKNLAHGADAVTKFIDAQMAKAKK